jgi:paraquat-inducible protein B
VAELGNLIEKDWRADLRQMEDSNQRQISLLEQRISKLVRALESTDQVLAQIQQRQQHSNELTPTGDKTASSRSGLDPNGPLYRKKSQLLQALFQANLKLRELDQGDHR